MALGHVYARGAQPDGRFTPANGEAPFAIPTSSLAPPDGGGVIHAGVSLAHLIELASLRGKVAIAVRIGSPS